MDLDDMWFQHDGATSHTANVTIDLLKSKFGERLISKTGQVNWLPCLCDLTPLYYFLLGHVKALVYPNNQSTLEELRTNIHREIAAVSANLCGKVVENWIQRLDFVKCVRSSYSNDIESHS
uniref:Putative LOC100569746 [Acyrthosiphon pisum] n=1 Tax=Lepeophtheirus salmonis TaxID=72036 RepID=A0A0K2T983_LEPSM